MLDKLLGLVKKDNFFLELKEDSSEIIEKVETVATQVKEETTKVVNKATKEVKQVVEEAKPVVASTVENVKSEANKVIEDIKSEDNKETLSAAKSQKTSSKKPATESQKSATESQKPATESQKPATNPQPVIDTSYSEEPFWVKLMYKTNEQKVAEKEAERGFATEYLISKPKARRRPGGSLDEFKKMASQTKTKF